MVTKPDLPTPPASTVPPKLPPIDPATLATSPGIKSGSGADVANRDRSGDSNFVLPDRVTQQEIKDGSYKYGGGRSAGKRSTER